MKLKVFFDFDFVLNEKMLNFVYLPIIGNKELGIYTYLYNQALFNEKIGNNISFNLEDIFKNLQLTQNEFDQIRTKLEAIGLLKTYLDPYKKDGLFIKLISALDWQSFISKQNMLNLLKSSVSEIDYERIKICFNKNELDGLVDISATFETKFSNVPTKTIDFNQLHHDLFNMSNEINELSNELKIRIKNLYEKENVSYHDLLTSLYKSWYKVGKKLSFDERIFELQMKSIIDSKQIHKFNNPLKANRNLNIFLEQFTKEEFDKIIANYRSINSEQYLACIQSAPVSKNDLDLIDKLRNSYKLPDFIINLLIDFSILVNKGKIEPIYLTSIALTINRMNYDNIDSILVHLRNTAKYKMKNN